MRRALFAFVVLTLTVGGCGAATMQISGAVVSVDQVSLTEVRTFTLRTAAGEMLTFRVGNLDLTGGFPANHLREHMATVSPVLVEYTGEDGERIAVRLTDAP